ncbi:MAG: FtsX-like permease family protein [Beduini sp.]
MNKIYTPLSVGQSLSEDSSTLTSAIYYLNDPQNIDALKNSETFATMFLTVVIVAGSLILALVLILTMRQRFYEIGVFLSLGQSKFKIVLQHLLEIVVIACVGFSLSLTTGKMVSNFVGGMLEQGQSKSEVVMVKDGRKDDANSENEISKEDLFQGLNQMEKAPENQEYDVSLSGHTIMKLGRITLMICIISTLVPTVYILRLSPREILMRKEG